MFRTVVVFVAFLLFYTGVTAQEVFRIPAQFKALGNASVSLQSPLAVFSNPAGIASVESMFLGLSYENRFLLDELQTASAFFVIPISKTKFGFSFSQFGFQSYHENKWSLAVSKQLFDRLLAGIQFHGYNLYLPENSGSASALLVDLGAQIQLSENFWLGAQLFNPYEVNLQQLALVYDFPLVWRVGMHKTFENTVLFVAEMKKWEGQAFSLSAGMEVRFKEQLQVRLGVDTQQHVFSMGVGYSSNGLQTDLAFSYHQLLGYTPSVSIYYQLP